MFLFIYNYLSNVNFTPILFIEHRITKYQVQNYYLKIKIFILVPVMIYSLTEQNIPSKQLLNEPKLYKRNRGNSAMDYLHIIG